MKEIEFIEQDGKVRYIRRDIGEWCDVCGEHTVNCFGFWMDGDEKYTQLCLNCMKALGKFAETQKVMDEPPEPPSTEFVAMD